jgi:threonylcarbamoyladenosine tRNA methylthiotransferase CDKAL1
MGGVISRGKCELVESEADADVRVLVTCSVKSVTEERMLGRIRELSREGKKVVVAGCLSKSEPDKILKINSNLSLIGPGNLDKILPAIQATLSGSQLISTETTKLVKLGMPRTRKNSLVGVIEIASGCLSSCTFCQVKLIKGTVFSYPEGEILQEARRLLSQGAKEIWLTSTDNAAYGRDSKTSLPRLVRAVSSLSGDFKIRVGMMNPLLAGKMLEELIDAFADDKVFKFLHLPVQSGNNRILKLMQRGYTIDDFYNTVHEFRASIRNLTLSTDMIVGFPSESESEFEDSMELLKRVRADIVNLSRFGARPGTKAAIMDEQLPAVATKDRSARMTALSKEISEQNNQTWIGWEGKVLFDEIDQEALIGRNYAYKPCVLKDELIHAGDGKDLLLGRQAIARIGGATAHTLRISELLEN